MWKLQSNVYCVVTDIRFHGTSLVTHYTLIHTITGVHFCEGLMGQRIMVKRSSKKLVQPHTKYTHFEDGARLLRTFGDGARQPRTFEDGALVGQMTSRTRSNPWDPHKNEPHLDALNSWLYWHATPCHSRPFLQGVVSGNVSGCVRPSSNYSMRRARRHCYVRQIGALSMPNFEFWKSDHY